MSLDPCQHLGHKLPDRRTCVLLCDVFPACLPQAVLELLTYTEEEIPQRSSSEDSAALKVRRQAR